MVLHFYSWITGNGSTHYLWLCEEHDTQELKTAFGCPPDAFQYPPLPERDAVGRQDMCRECRRLAGKE